MTTIIPMLVVLPLLGAGINMALWRHVRIQQILGVSILGSSLVMSLFLLRHVDKFGPVAVHLGDWAAPVGITLVADVFAILLLTVALIALLAVFVYAIGQPRADKGAFYFHSLYLVLAAGIAGSFLAGDLFNLFVSIEMMLSASYVLITLGGSKPQVRSGMTYVIINLVASTLLVTTIGLVYAATGTVNMADAAAKLQEVPEGVSLAIGGLMLVTFGIKAAIFPLFFWLPDSYPTAPVTVTAVFAGLLTKIGMYAIIRTQTLMFPSDGQSMNVMLIIAAATMIIGAVGAIAQNDMKRILSFSIVSQIGYILFGLSLNTAAGIAAAVFFLVHQIPVKTALFLVQGLVETVTGSSALDKAGGLLRNNSFIAVMFGIAGLSLVGVPPFSGFFGKVALVEAGFASGKWVVTAISLLVSVLTLIYITKIWANLFWGDKVEKAPIVTQDGRVFELPDHAPRLMNASTLGIVCVSVLL
ncbi:MAG TPA: proton-conducting transporter membrane subunit, partial [Microthrixaceae bacterium]|nr:proton-conducting transporter membrane subunit [Microthrixaceae bacterium]